MKSKTRKSKDAGLLGIVHSIESAIGTVAQKTGLASKPARRGKAGSKTSKASSASRARGTAKAKSGARGKSKRSKR